MTGGSGVARIALCALWRFQEPNGARAMVPLFRKPVIRRVAGSATLASVAAAVSMSSKGPAQSASAPIRVVTYNVLSSSLCEPTYFIKCAPEHLDPPKRLEKVIHVLEDETAKEAIICLQEVSRQWIGPLQVFFAAHGYSFSSSLYGKYYNGYMGVALAWPSERFQLKDLEHQRLADLIPEQPRSEQKQIVEETLMTKTMKQLSDLFSSQHEKKSKPKPFDVWNEASRRQNVLLSAKFCDTKQNKNSFSISTYHMPCLFGSIEKEQVMVIHAALAAQRAKAFAKGGPFVLTGDFNIKPEDACYAMLTANALPSEHEPPPQPSIHTDTNPFLPKVEPPLISAYKAKQGKEPEFTNFAFNKWMNDSFVATLDYIFCSDHWQVRFVKPLKPISEIDTKKGSFPDEDEPSDHVLIAADLELTDK